MTTTDEQLMHLDAAEMEVSSAAGAVHVALGEYTQLVLYFHDEDREYFVNKAWDNVQSANARLLDARVALDHIRREVPVHAHHA